MKGKVGTLVKTMSLLNALGENGPMGVMELSRMLDMEKSGVSRLLSTLKSGAYVRILLDGRYDLGTRIFELGQVLQARMPVRQVVIPHVEALSRETGETASAAHYHLGQIAYLHDAISDQDIRLGGRVGVRCLPWNDVCGKAILAFCEEDYVLECLEFDRKSGDNFIPSSKALLPELAGIRKRGFAIEKTDDRYVVAAALPNNQHPSFVAVMCGGPTSRIRSSDIKRLGNVTVYHANEAAMSLG